MVLQPADSSGLGTFRPRQANRGSSGNCNAILYTSSVAERSRISPQTFRRERHHRGVKANVVRPLPLHASYSLATAVYRTLLANGNVFDFLGGRYGRS